MKKIAFYRAFMQPAFAPRTALEMMHKEVKKIWNKNMKGFKKTWDFNADSGLKEIWQKGKEIRLVTHVYGNMTVFALTEKEMKEELKEKQDDSFNNWVKVG